MHMLRDRVVALTFAKPEIEFLNRFFNIQKSLNKLRAPLY